MVGGAQPAGTDMGEAAENFPSRSPTVHPSAAQPGTDAHTNSAAQIDGDTEAGGGGMPGKSTDSKVADYLAKKFLKGQN